LKVSLSSVELGLLGGTVCPNRVNLAKTINRRPSVAGSPSGLCNRSTFAVSEQFRLLSEDGSLRVGQDGVANAFPHDWHVVVQSYFFEDTKCGLLDQFFLSVIGLVEEGQDLLCDFSDHSPILWDLLGVCFVPTNPLSDGINANFLI
jgi:hypothetical protein